MAEKHWTLQLTLPCRVSEATEWWEEVSRVIGEGDAAHLSTVDHADGHTRLTVHLQEST